MVDDITTWFLPNCHETVYRESAYIHAGALYCTEEHKDEYLANLKNPATPMENNNKTIENTLAERGQRYGSFLDNSKIAQDLKRILQKADGWQRLAPDQREALEVICQKISRIMTGDANYDDNWHDIEGYARLIYNSLQGEVK